MWLGRLLNDVVDIKLRPPKLRVDNMSAIALSKNPVRPFSMIGASTLIRNIIIP